jgi:hypothetical protein
MPNVTVVGANRAIVPISINSTAAATLAQNVLNAVSAVISGNPSAAVNFSGTVPSTGTELVFGGTPNAVTVPAGSPFTAFTSNAVGNTSISTAQTTAATVVAGTGGLTYTQTALSVTGGSVIVAGGGASNINLAAGANTVSLDITPTATTQGGLSVGTATVNALGGGAAIIVNAATNSATTNDNALIALAGSDSISIGGSAFVLLNDTTNAVTIQSGGAGFFANGSATQAGTNINTSPGNETVGVLTGYTESINGAAGTVSGGNAIYVAGATGVTGSLFINPGVQNVTVFAGAGSTTLFGAGDGSATNTGSDVVLAGTGYIHAGSGGNSLLISAASISGGSPTTLIGGGTGDVLYAQSANVSLKGSAGTALLAASGLTISGGITSLGSITVTSGAGTTFSVGGASGGDTLNAGGANAAIFGATSGGNTIISGTGSSTVFGHSGASGGTGNTYLDGGVGSMTIEDFKSSDLFKLTGSQTVASATATTGGTLVTLSDGTKITVIGGVVSTTNTSTYFHS